MYVYGVPIVGYRVSRGSPTTYPYIPAPPFLLLVSAPHPRPALPGFPPAAPETEVAQWSVGDATYLHRPARAWFSNPTPYPSAHVMTAARFFQRVDHDVGGRSRACCALAPHIAPHATAIDQLPSYAKSRKHVLCRETTLFSAVLFYQSDRVSISRFTA